MIKRPKCGKSHYSNQGGTTTCLGWEPIYKDGVLVNSDPNKTTWHYHCLECGENPCEGCEWLGKPYHSIVSPCEGCTRNPNKIVTSPKVTYSTNTDYANSDSIIRDKNFTEYSAVNKNISK